MDQPATSPDRRDARMVGSGRGPAISRRNVLRQLGAAGLLAGAYTLWPAAVRAAPPGAITDSIDGFPTATAGRSRPVATPIAFAMVGFELPDDLRIEFRTSSDGEAWSPWVATRRIAADNEGPDQDSDEDGARWRRMSHPVWVREARWLQVRGADPSRVRAHLVDTVGLSQPASARTAAALLETVGSSATAEAAPYPPQVVTRAGWGADESWRDGSPNEAPLLRFAVIHHTATGNGYSQAEVPAILRGIYRYHTQMLGWDDIGYNLLVDRFGRIFEGRYGGIDRPVIGAHAYGYNRGSVGVAALGCFDHDGCTGGAVSAAMIDGLDKVVAWKFAQHGIDPYATIVDPHATTHEESDQMPTIVGHRDVGSTACPGGELYHHVRGDRPMAHRVWTRIHGFRDVPPSSTFAADIAWIAAAGITGGTNPPANDLFRPEGLVSRAQMAAFLVRALDLTDDAHPGFVDVPPGSTFERDIRRIAKAGITDGCTTDRFCPADPVSRAQMAAFLVRALDLTDDAHPGFVDVPQGSTFERDIRRIAKAGITDGCTTDRFCPADPVSRGQMAAFLHRAFAR